LATIRHCRHYFRIVARHYSERPDSVFDFPGLVRNQPSSLGSVRSATLVTISDELGGSESDSVEERARSSLASFQEDRLRSGASSVTKDSTSITATRADLHLKFSKLFEHFKSVYRKLGLSHFIPVVMLLLYSVAGASILLLIEGPYEEQVRRNEKNHSENVRNHAVERLGQILKDKELSLETKLYASRDLIIWYEEKLGIQKTVLLRWDIWSALFYVGTIFTTIGYGNIYARSTGGRILSVIYALIGVPLALTILNDMGNVLSRRINQFWIWVKRHGRKQSTLSHFHQESEETEEEIPLCVALLLTLSWMLFCAGLFCVWESQWNYLTALYFFFISLSTIGLGDVTPSCPRLMVINFGLVMIGLSLVSMTINVCQRHIELFLSRMVNQMQDTYARALESGTSPDHSALLAQVWSKQPWYVRYIVPTLLGQSGKLQLVQGAQQVVSRPPTQCGTQTELRRPLSRHSVAVDAPPKYTRSSYTQTTWKSKDNACQVCLETASTSAQVSASMDPLIASFRETEMQTSTYATITRDMAVQVEAEQQAVLTQTDEEVEFRDTEVQTDSSYVRKAKWLSDLSHVRARNLEIMAVPISRIHARR
ncbi:Ion trans 2 domain containing protein, partial [Trichuris trichiura]